MPNHSIEIAIKSQLMLVLLNNKIIKSYSISSALNGLGQENNSFQTPLGEHYIAEKFGENAPLHTIFKARQAIRLFDNNLNEKKDWILTRILRLAGLEKNFNLGENVDTYSRYIYIHGTSDEKQIGQAVSKGCIRMLSTDIVKLYDLITIGTKVLIYE